jgi:hypothetical protein
LLNQEQLQIKNAPKSTLHIYEILGKELLQTAIRSVNETIDVSHLPNGILMVVLDDGEFRLAKKIVKTGN